MDEVLLRRLVGAAVLLAGAFLLASLLPEPDGSGRPEAAVRYDLRSGQPIPGPAPPVDPVSPAPETVAPAPPARANLRVDETLGRHGGWFIQVGSFGNQANARGVLEKLYGLGLPTVIQTVPVGRDLWYRVRVGPYENEPEAQRALERIRKEGYAAAKIVRPEAQKPAAN
jgi:DedD protein